MKYFELPDKEVRVLERSPPVQDSATEMVVFVLSRILCICFAMGSIIYIIYNFNFVDKLNIHVILLLINLRGKGAIPDRR